MANVVEMVAGTVFLIFGIHALMTRRVTFGDDGDDLQVWLYGWRAIGVGCAALGLSALCFSSVVGLFSFDFH